MNITWKRTLRTPSSERFLALKDGKDAAAVDLHYLPNGTVSGTVIVLRSAGLAEADIPKLLASLDEDYLPDVDLQHGTLTFTVVWGDVLANYEATTDGPSVA
ncbi:MAG: hypothetical protein MUF81_11395 [Verrucomicrobia bacterium]|jgi:hypothetical protein|nr:hypothetical protein [Verrucomicrobiota bacterium]